MKCPKCGYIGFESGNRCRNCGYDFSLAPPAADEFQRGNVTESADLYDLDLQEPPPSNAGRRSSGADDFDKRDLDTAPGADLPLFADRGDEAEPLLPLTPVPPRTPLSVRRSTPPAPRMRPREPVRPRPEPVELRLDPEPVINPPAAATRTSVVEPAIAGGFRRLAAAVIDLAILVPLNLAVVYLTLRMCSIGFDEVLLIATPPMAGFLILLNGGYLLAFTAVGGQTIGKMAARIRVVDEDNVTTLGFGQAALRTVAYVASLLPAGVGFVPAFTGQTHRALHDRIANTRVVRL